MLSRRSLGCWFGSGDMSAAGQLQGLLQLVPAMRCEVLPALSAAAQAEQRATDAETRVLAVRGERSCGHFTAWRSEKRRRCSGHLETVHVYVVGLRWCS